MARRDQPAGVPEKHRLNERIRVSPVRVIGPEGEPLGIMSTAEALSQAQAAGVDLVEVGPNERPPVCRIMDYGKFKYRQKKRAHKSTTHQTKTKEIRVRPKTGQNDIDVKVNRARGFLEHKDKVLVTVIFRGREMAHIEEGQRVIEGIIAQLEDVAKIEAPPRQNGRRMNCTLAPK